MADEESSDSNTAAKKSTAKKSAAKRSPAKKPAAKKSAAKKSPARRSAPRAESRPRSSDDERASRRSTGSRIVGEAVRQFSEMSNKHVEGVTGLQRTDDGWTVEIDVLELRRVPETTDVLASYEVTVDSSGEIEGYRRVHRYVRGQAEDQP
jgi:hypothetical protein